MTRSTIVTNFRNIIIDHLLLTRILKILNVIEFTDGAASQFKSRIPLADLSYGPQKVNIRVQRNFFGSCLMVKGMWSSTMWIRPW